MSETKAATKKAAKPATKKAATKKPDTIDCIACRTLADDSGEMFYAGDPVTLSREAAIKLQDANAIKIVL